MQTKKTIAIHFKNALLCVWLGITLMSAHAVSAQPGSDLSDWRQFPGGAEAVCVDDDIDNDNDGLIEVCYLDNLDAIRYQLNGEAYQSTSGAMPVIDGCATGGCKGYELVRDLDFNDNDSYRNIANKAQWTTTAMGGWLPIGHGSNRFSAMFEGNGYTLSGLTIDRESPYIGLFGATSKMGVISRIGLLDANVSNRVAESNFSYVFYAGSLVGSNEGTISNSYNTGRVGDNGQTSSGGQTGGLVGWNGGTIRNSYNTGQVTIVSHRTGGLVGRNKGTISNSYNTGQVRGRGRVGGLVGENDGGTIINSHNTGQISDVGDEQFAGGLVGSNGGTISNSYSIGSVSGGYGVGSLVGWNGGTISNSYSRGSVNGAGNNVGGLVGWNDQGGTISNSYSRGSVNGTGNNIGGLVGRNSGTISNSYSTGLVRGHSDVGGLVGVVGQFAEFTARVNNSYWDREASGVLKSAGGTSKTTVQLQMPTAATDIYSAWSKDNWYFGTTTEYPIIRYTTGTDASNRACGVRQQPLCDSVLAGQGRILIFISTQTLVQRADVQEGEIVVFRAEAGHAISDAVQTSGTSLRLERINNAERRFQVPPNLFDRETLKTTLTFQLTVSGNHSSTAIFVVHKQNNGDGTPTLTQSGRTLTAQLDLATDPDNTSTRLGTIVRYQWQRNDGTQTANWVRIEGARAPSYLIAEDVKYQTPFRVHITYIDGQGYQAEVSAHAVYDQVKSGSKTVCADDDIDNDNDGLIEICHLDGLDAMRYVLDGSGYKASASAAAKTSGCARGGCKGYELVRDLDFNDDDSYMNIEHKARWTTAEDGGWPPIGNLDNRFSGIFEGNGYTLSDLTINSGSPYAGLFGASSGTIARVGLLNVDVQGRGRAGGLVGGNWGTISNSYSTGQVRGTNRVGGLVGIMEEGTVVNSYSAVQVTGTERLGGLVGWSRGTIINSYSTGSVRGSRRAESLGRAGGLVGEMPGGMISNSYSRASANGSREVGGLVGRNAFATISNSYSTGQVDGSHNDLGGLVGYNYGGTIDNSYSIGQVNGTDTSDNVGSFVGRGNGGIIRNSYSSGQAHGDDHVGNLVGRMMLGTIDNSGGKTSTELQTPTAAVNLYSRWKSGWDFGLPDEYPAVTYTAGTNADYPACGVVSQPRCGSLVTGQRTGLEVTEQRGTVGAGDEVSLIKPKGGVVSYEQTAGPSVLPRATTSTYRVRLEAPKDSITQGISTQITIVRTLSDGSTEDLVLIVNRDVALHPAANTTASEGETVTVGTEDLGNADLSFEWHQIQGPNILTDAVSTNTNTLIFAVPNTFVQMGKLSILRFEVIIKDAVTTVTRVLAVTVFKKDNGKIDLSLLSPTKREGSRVLSAPFIPLKSDPDSTTNNLGRVTRYQWQRQEGESWLNINGARASIYTVAAGVPDQTPFRVQLSYADGQGYVVTGHSTTVVYDLVNSTPTVSITKATIKTTEGESVTIDASGTMDNDGDALTYLWQQVSDDGVDVLTGVDTNTARLTFNTSRTFVGATTDQVILRFLLTVSDVYSTATQEAVVTVRKRNDGSITLTTPTQVVASRVLTAEFDWTADPDSTADSPGSLRDYQWLRGEGMVVSSGTSDDMTTITTTYTVPDSVAENEAYRLQIRYTDGQGYATTVTSPPVMYRFINSTPTISIAQATIKTTEGESVTIDARGTMDKEGDALTYLWHQADDGTNVLTEVDTNTAILTFNTPRSFVGATTDQVVLRFLLTVSDAHSVTTEQAVVTVHKQNDGDIRPTVTRVGRTLTAQLDLRTDPDSTAATPGILRSYQWQRQRGEDWTNIGGARAPMHTVAAEVPDQTPFRVQITYTDGQGYATTVHSDAIIYRSVNTPPTISIARATIKTIEGESVTIDARSTMDSDGDALTYLWQQLSDDGADVLTGVDTNTATLTFNTPRTFVAATTDQAVLIFVLTVSDAHSSATQEAVVTVSKRNDGDITLTLPTQEGASRVLTAEFDWTADPDSTTDSPGSLRDYQWLRGDGTVVSSGTSDDMTMITTTYTVPGSVAENEAYRLQVRYTDGQGHATTVTSPPVMYRLINSTPTISIARATIKTTEGESVTIKARAMDSDGDTLMYRWSQISGSTVLSGDTSTNTLTLNTSSTFVAATTDQVVLRFLLTVSDAHSATTKQVVVTVRKRNDGDISPTVTQVGRTLTAQPDLLTDPDSTAATLGTVHSYQWQRQESGEWLSIDSARASMHTVAAEVPDQTPFRVQITYTDGQGYATTVHSATITYSLVNTPPTISITQATIHTTEGETVTIDARAIDSDGDHLMYSWSQVLGDTAVLGDTSTNTLTLNTSSTFVAATTHQAVLVFVLTVSDAHSTTTKQVVVTVRKQNDGTIGLTLTGGVGAATLTAEITSADPDGTGTAPMYQWQFCSLSADCADNNNWAPATGATNAARYAVPTSSAMSGDKFRVIVTYTDGQDYRETVSATHEYDTGNQRPRIETPSNNTSIRVKEGRTQSISVVVSDNDTNDILTLSLTATDSLQEFAELPAEQTVSTNGTITRSASILTLKGLKAGITTLSLVVKDDSGSTADDTSAPIMLIITVTANTTPTISGLPTEEYTLQLDAGARQIDVVLRDDDDDDAAMLSASVASSTDTVVTVAIEDTMESTRQITVTPHSAGTATISVTLSDGRQVERNSTVTQHFTVRVNTRPVLAMMMTTQTVTRGIAVDRQIITTNTFTDADGDALTYTVIGLPTGLRLSGSRLVGMTTTKATTNVAVAHLVTVVAADSYGGATSATFRLLINAETTGTVSIDSSSAPDTLVANIEEVSDANGLVESQTSYQWFRQIVAGSDFEAAPGATSHSRTYTLPAGAAGRKAGTMYRVIVNFVDHIGQVTTLASADYEIGNEAPVIAALAPVSTTEGLSVAIDVTDEVSDPNADALSYAWRVVAGDKPSSLLAGQMTNAATLTLTVPTDWVAGTEAKHTTVTLQLTVSDAVAQTIATLPVVIVKTNNGPLTLAAAPTRDGETLTAPMLTLTDDPDSNTLIPGSILSHQWQFCPKDAPDDCVADSNNWVSAAGATDAASYAVPTSSAISGNKFRVIVTYTDGQGYRETVFATHVYNTGNQAPSIEMPSNNTSIRVKEGRTQSISVVVSDNDTNDVLTLSLTATDPSQEIVELPAEQTVSNNGAIMRSASILTLKGLKAGMTTLSLVVKDDSGSTADDTSAPIMLIITVTANTTPTISGLPTEEYTLQLDAGARQITATLGDDDDDDTAASLSASVISSKEAVVLAIIDSAMSLTRQITVTPHSAGTATISVTLSDGRQVERNSTVTQHFIVRVNTQPALAMMMTTQTVTRGIAVDRQIISTNTFTDADGDALAYTVTGLPTGLRLSGSRLVGMTTTTATTNVAVAHLVTVVAADSYGGATSATFRLLINAETTGTVSIDSSSAPDTLVANIEEVSDANGLVESQTSYQWFRQMVAGSDFEAAPGTTSRSHTYTLPAGAAGRKAGTMYQVRVSFVDHIGQVTTLASADYEIGNEAPVIAALAPVSTTEGLSVTIDVTDEVSDPNADALSYAWRVVAGDKPSSLLAGQMSNAATLTLTVPTDWVVSTEAKHTTVTLQLTVSDAAAQTVATLPVVIVKTNNGPLTLAAAPTRDGETLTAPMLTLTDDPDSNTLIPGSILSHQWQFCPKDAPDDCVADSNNWVPASGATDAASYAVPTSSAISGNKFRVIVTYTDGQGYRETVSALHVYNTGNQAPSIEMPGNNTSIRVKEGRTQSISVVVSDNDTNDILTLSLTATDPSQQIVELPAEQTVSNNGAITRSTSTLTLKGLKAGITTLSLVVKDDSDSSVDDTSAPIMLIITVTANTTPTISGLPTEEYTLQLDAGARQIDVVLRDDDDDDAAMLSASVASSTDTVVAVAIEDTMESTRQITVTPHSAGTATISVTLSDGRQVERNSTVTQHFTVRVNTQPVLAVMMTTQTVTRGIAVDRQIISTNTFTDADGDTLAYTVTGLPTGLRLSGSRLVGMTTTTATTNVAVAHLVTVVAADSYGGATSATFRLLINAETTGTVSIDSSSAPDTLVANIEEVSDANRLVESQTSYQWFRQVVAGSDFEVVLGATSKTYTLPAGAAGRKAGTMYRVRVSFVDHIGQVTTLASADYEIENKAPVIVALAPFSTTEGLSVTIDVTDEVSDPNADALSYAWRVVTGDKPSSLLAGQMSNAATLTLTVPTDWVVGTEAKHTTVTLQLTVSDATTQTVATLSVVIVKADNGMIGLALTGGLSTVPLKASITADPDGGNTTLTFQWQSCPHDADDNCVADSSRWTPISDAPNTQTYSVPDTSMVGDKFRVVVAYTDRQGYATTVTSDLREYNTVNSRPAIVALSPDSNTPISVQEGRTTSISVVVADSNTGDKLTLSLSAEIPSQELVELPAAQAVVANNRTTRSATTLRLKGLKVGMTTLSLVVKDNSGSSVDDASVPVMLIVTVTANTTPTISGLPAEEYTLQLDGGAQQIDVVLRDGDDDDADRLSASVISSADAVVRVAIEDTKSSTRRITMTPESAGTATISVVLSDGRGIERNSTVTQHFIVRVNTQPVLAMAITTQAVTQRLAVNKQIITTTTFIDADGDALTYTATGLPTGLMLSAGGRLTGVTVATATTNAAAHLVTVIAADSYGGATSATFRLLIKAATTATVTISSASNDRLLAKAELAVARATFTATDWQQFLGGAQAVCDDSDIDNDDDSLIEVCYLEDLDAIRYALDGSGLKSSAEASLRTEGCGSDICRGYELVRDLDFNDDGSYRNATTNKTKWTTATGWLPIGSDANRFSGIFEGNGHILSHLTIHSTRSDMALFGGLSSAAIINGMGLLYAEVHGGNHVGSLVARNGGTIINSYSSGLVSGSGSHVGGLAARNDSTISNSYSSGRVSSTGDYIGGLVGWNRRGTINNSYSSGLVSGTDTVGGLVGWNTSGTISNSYNRGPVAGGDIVGGLAGRNTNVISNSYSSAPVTGSGSDIGDLIGLNDDSATLSHSSSKTSTELQTPTAATGIYSTWSSVFWDFGTADNYPAVKHAPGTDTRYISCGTSQQPTCGSLLFWQRLFVISTATNIQIEVKEGEAVGLSVVHAAGVTYQWHQTTGVSLSLGTTDTAELRFFVPNNVVDRNTTTGLLRLKLTLSDGTSQTISLIVTKVDNTVMTTPLIVIDEVENILLVAYNLASDLDGVGMVQRYQWQICRGSAAAVVCNDEDNWQPAPAAPSSAFYIIPDSEAVAGNQFRVRLTYTDGQNNTQTVTSTVFSYQETKAIRVRIKLFLEGALQ